MPDEIINCSPDIKLDVGIIGAGISGINAAIQLQKQLGISSFTIFESNDDIGGTWLTNTYPGCACDTPSHLYSYSFELNPNWTESFASQPEIWKYLKFVCEKYNVYKYVKFNTSVRKLTWNEKLFKWIAIVVDNKDENAVENEIAFDIIINCVGPFRIPNIPKEFLAFEGPLMHTAQWNPGLSLENKKVAIIGSGASAIQVIPKLVNSVKELHSYQRKPAYVVKRFQHRYPDFILTLFAYVPFLMWLLRCSYFFYIDIFHKQAFKPNSLINKYGIRDAKLWRRKQIPDNKELRKDLTPNYDFGCKRVTPSELYYPAMILPNVKLHRSHIDKIIGKTIYTKDGNSVEIDILIIATGYRVQDYFAPVEYKDKNGEDMMQNWKNFGPQSYYGIASSCAPNIFYILGPNTGLGHNSITFQIECQTNFIMKMIKEMMRRNVRCVTLKEDAEEEFMKKLKADLKETVWGTTDCGSWYADARGEITTLWPHNCIQYWQQTRNVDFSKFDFRN